MKRVYQSRRDSLGRNDDSVEERSGNPVFFSKRSFRSLPKKQRNKKERNDNYGALGFFSGPKNNVQMLTTQSEASKTRAREKNTFLDIQFMALHENKTQ